MNKKIILLVIAIAIVVLGVILSRSKVSQEAVAPAEDSTAMISKELGALEVSDLDKEFQAIDADLQGL